MTGQLTTRSPHGIVAASRVHPERTHTKSYRKALRFNVPARRGLTSIISQVEEGLRESGIVAGVALVSAMHITASENWIPSCETTKECV